MRRLHFLGLSLRSKIWAFCLAAILGLTGPATAQDVLSEDAFADLAAKLGGSASAEGLDATNPGPVLFEPTG